MTWLTRPVSSAYRLRALLICVVDAPGKLAGDEQPRGRIVRDDAKAHLGNDGLVLEPEHALRHRPAKAERVVALQPVQIVLEHPGRSLHALRTPPLPPALASAVAQQPLPMFR